MLGYVALCPSEVAGVRRTDPSTRHDPRPPFHLAFPATSLAKARKFSGEPPGCPEGDAAVLRLYLI